MVGKSHMLFCINIFMLDTKGINSVFNYAPEGEKISPSHDMPFWHIDYFTLVIFRKQQRHKKLLRKQVGVTLL